MNYKWLLKHKRSGRYVVIENLGLPNETVGVTDDPKDATHYDKREHALDVLGFLSTSASFPECEPIDKVFHDEPAPDADQQPVRTRAEVLADAKAAGEPRRAEHAAIRARARMKPAGRVINREPEPPRRGEL